MKEDKEWREQTKIKGRNDEKEINEE